MRNIQRKVFLGILTASLIGSSFATACDTKKAATTNICPSTQKTPAPIATKKPAKAEAEISPIAKAAQKKPATNNAKIENSKSQPPRDPKDPGPIAPQ